MGLSTVEGLRKGRSKAKEPRKILPIPQAHIEAIRPHVSRQVWSLVQLQLLTGARPGELLDLRRIDIDTSGKVWIAGMSRHKTSYIGRDREILFGPEAQLILKSFFQGKDLVDPLFSPKDARRENGAKADTHRREAQPPTPRRTTRTIGDAYTVSSLNRAITRACLEADVPRWHPNRLRHTAGTRIRKEFGLDAAQAVLGHAHADITQVYAEVNRARAAEIMVKMG
jgi:integrase